MSQQKYEIKYGTEQHGMILSEIRRRFDLSYRKMSEKHDKWDEAENLFRGHLTETDETRLRKDEYRKGKPTYFTIYIPYSYAVLLAAHTYWTSVFLGRTPVLQFTARHGEPEMGVQALEALIDYQVTVGKHLVPYYIWMLDAGKFGVGIVGNYWARETHTVASIVERPVTFMGLPLPGVKPKREKQVQEIEGYVGSRVFNVRPHDFYPDPRVALIHFQDGEFCGRITRVGFNSLLKNPNFFNLEEAGRAIRSGGLKQTVSAPISQSFPNWEDFLGSRDGVGKDGFAELGEMTIELSPKDFGLGGSVKPEKWVFTVAQDAVIIGCSPLGCIHNRFPFDVMSYEIDGYSHVSRGMMEVTKPLNDAMSWLVNSHFFNVRKALNDQLIVDPQRVNMKDLEEGGPGRMIRLKPAAYGTDVRSVLMQIPHVDVTRGHMADLQLFGDLFQRISGVSDNVMGMVNSSGRKSATEIRTSSNFSINRLKTFSEYNSALGMAPLAQALVQNTQQYYDQDKMFKIAGDLLAFGPKKFMQVTPEMISGFYDFVPVDGTLPVDRFAQANLWKEILLGLHQVPQLAMQFDIAGIFSWMATLSGLKNINQFRIQVTPDQQFARAQEAGNLTPLGGNGSNVTELGSTGSTGAA